MQNRCLVPATSFSEYNDTPNHKSLKNPDGRIHGGEETCRLVCTRQVAADVLICRRCQTTPCTLLHADQTKRMAYDLDAACAGLNLVTNLNVSLAGGTHRRGPPSLACRRRYHCPSSGAPLTGLGTAVGPASRRLRRRRYADAPAAASFSDPPLRYGPQFT
jgi:hypothetical protein